MGVMGIMKIITQTLFFMIGFCLVFSENNLPLIFTAIPNLIGLGFWLLLLLTLKKEIQDDNCKRKIK